MRRVVPFPISEAERAIRAIGIRYPITLPRTSPDADPVETERRALELKYADILAGPMPPTDEEPEHEDPETSP